MSWSDAAPIQDSVSPKSFFSRYSRFVQHLSEAIWAAWCPLPLSKATMAAASSGAAWPSQEGRNLPRAPFHLPRMYKNMKPVLCPRWAIPRRKNGS